MDVGAKTTLSATPHFIASVCTNSTVFGHHADNKEEVGP